MLFTSCSSAKITDTKQAVEQTTVTPDTEQSTTQTNETTVDPASDESADTLAANNNANSDTATTPEVAAHEDGNTKKSESNTSTDMSIAVVDYIMNGQEDKPAADQILWSKTFLDQVDLRGLCYE